MAAGHLKLGQEGEEIARDYLVRQGYVILERNWRCRMGELDIICSKGDMIVFVEVKTRVENSLGLPGEAMTAEKGEKLWKAAAQYLSKNQLWEQPCRFDLITATKGKDSFVLEHITNVVEPPPTLGRRNTSWQPW